MTRSVQNFMLWGVAGVLLLAHASSVHAQDCDPVENIKLLASGGGSFRAEFGGSVSIDGDTAVIGANFHAETDTRTGAAYVFIRSEGEWIQQAKLLPDDGGLNYRFGASVSVSGDTAVIGASNDDDNGSLSGSAYVFTRSGGLWTLQAKLLADDGATVHHFGHSVALNGDTTVIGAYGDDDNGDGSGSAYVFTRSGGVWTQQAKLLADDGASGEQFGISVSLSVNTTLIGAWRDTDNGSYSGSAYVFTSSGGVWTQQAKLLAGDRAAFDFFGCSVALDDDTALIGARGDDDNGFDSGSAYVFTRTGEIWSQQTELLADDGEAFDLFGYSVSFSGDAAVIGAFQDDDHGEFSGSAYVFTRSSGEWNQQAKLLPGDGAEDDFFGSAVALSGDTAVIGAWGDDVNSSAGSAYVFDLGCHDCSADLNGDGVVNTQDFLAFLSAWAASDPLADWNGDGVVNTQDFLAFLTDWTAGC